MRFDSLDEFLKYYYENGVSVVDIEFNITPTTDPAVNPDVIEEPAEMEPEDEVPKKLEETITAQYVTIFLPSGDINMLLDTDGMMVVEGLGMTPNACGAGYIIVDGRKVFLDMCEMDGRTVAYLPTKNGPREAIPVRVKK